MKNKGNSPLLKNKNRVKKLIKYLDGVTPSMEQKLDKYFSSNSTMMNSIDGGDIKCSICKRRIKAITWGSGYRYIHFSSVVSHFKEYHATEYTLALLEG